uniref:Uncharacterized protein n=1 Tax=Anguilla anguilla TaxID=7936 RepID=A0A0E9Q0K7_ANGAN
MSSALSNMLQYQSSTGSLSPYNVVKSIL